MLITTSWCSMLTFVYTRVCAYAKGRQVAHHLKNASNNSKKNQHILFTERTRISRCINLLPINYIRYGNHKAIEWSFARTLQYKKSKTDLLEWKSVLHLSLLSDSNQRPRDYKSRALAN